ncbi:hypothetical protein ACWCPQ_17265 [Nocardia sp. NPDC001965]
MPVVAATLESLWTMAGSFREPGAAAIRLLRPRPPGGLAGGLAEPVGS